MLYRTLAVVGLGLLLVGGVAHAALFSADGNLSDWGTWNTYGSGTGFVANTTVDFSTDWASTNNHQPQGNSGNEWYDIEGLYVDVSYEGDQTYLNWAIITSDSGLTPDTASNVGWGDGEWSGNLSDAVDGIGTGHIAQVRDNTISGGNANHFVYHRNPVIGLDLDGVAGRELGLVLDPTNTALLDGGKVATGWTTTTAALYRITDQANWKNPYVEGTDYTNWFVDLDTNGLSTVATTTENGRILWDAETTGQQMNYPALWPQANNFVWEGRMNITGLVTLAAPTATTNVSYGLFCGNDYAFDSHTGEFFGPPTPELSTWALLACSLLGVFSMGLRRRRSA